MLSYDPDSAIIAKVQLSIFRRLTLTNTFVLYGFYKKKLTFEYSKEIFSYAIICEAVLSN